MNIGQDKSNKEEEIHIKDHKRQNLQHGTKNYKLDNSKSCRLVFGNNLMNKKRRKFLRKICKRKNWKIAKTKAKTGKKIGKTDLQDYNELFKRCLFFPCCSK